MGDVLIRVENNRAVIAPFGASLLTPLVSAATAAKDGAETAQAAAEAAAADAASDVSTALAGYVTDAESARDDAEAAAASLSSTLTLFDDIASTNLFDPSTGVDGQVWLGNGATSVSARYGRILLPVTAGQSYTISCAYGPTSWDLDQQGFVNFYNSLTTFNGMTLVDSSTASPQENGVTYSDSGRTVSFTAPTGAVAVGVSVYNLVTATPTSGDFDALWPFIMANIGTSRAAYQEYIPAGTKDYPATVKNPLGKVRALLSGTTLYVWQPMWNDPTQAHVRKISYGDTPSSTEAGTMDFLEHRLVDSAYAEDQIVIAFNAGTSVWLGSDNGPPLRYNNTYLGGGHGMPFTYDLTIAGHGLTNANVGETATTVTSGSKVWVLSGIIDANTVSISAANTSGDDDQWSISQLPSPGSSGTITFSDSGAKSYTASVGRQHLPLAQNYTISACIDGTTDLVDGTPATGDSFELRESYGIPNPARWLALLISEKGTSSPKALNDPAVPTQIFVDTVWQFDRYGAMVGFTTYSNPTQPYRFDSNDYLGAWQHTAVTKTGYVNWQYIAGLGSAVGGLDFTATAQVSANASQRDVLNSIASDPTKPPAVFSQFLKLSGTPAFGLCHGYLPTTGVGKPAERADNTYAYRLSAAEKMYPVAIDAGAFASGIVPAGTFVSIGFWEQTIDMSDNPTNTVDAVLALPGGKALRIIDVHDTVSFDTLAMPADLTGRPVTVLESQGGFTLHSDEFVPSTGLKYSVSGGYGRAIIEIGP